MSDALPSKPVARDTLWQRILDSLPPVPVCVVLGAVAVLIPLLLYRYPMGWLIVSVISLIGLGVVLACPFAGLLIFLGLLYLRPEEYYPALAGARLTLNVSLLVFFAWGANALLCRGEFRFGLPAVRCFLGFLLVATGSTALAGPGELSLILLDLLKLLILYVLIIHLVNTELRLNVAIGTLVLFTALLGARTIWQYQNGEALVQSDGEVRALASGIFGDPNDLALAMNMALPLALGAVLGRGRWWTRLWSAAAVVILLWTVFVTNSRGGIVALAGVALVFFGRRLGRLGLIVGVAGVLALFSFGPSRLSHLSSEEESAQARVGAWEEGLTMLYRSPLWGVGKGQFVEHYFMTAHNSLVLCLAELGLAGTACWIGLFYFALRDGRRVATGAVARNATTAGGDEDTGARGSSPQIPGSGLEARAAQHPAGEPRRALPLSPSALLQISLFGFMLGGFFLSRTYTPPLYVYLGLAVAAAQVDAKRLGLTLPAARRRDWAHVVFLTLASVVLIRLLVVLWG